FFFQAEDGIREFHVTGVQTCALPISHPVSWIASRHSPGLQYPDPMWELPGLAATIVVCPVPERARERLPSRRSRPPAGRTAAPEIGRATGREGVWSQEGACWRE